MGWRSVKRAAPALLALLALVLLADRVSVSWHDTPAGHAPHGAVATPKPSLRTAAVPKKVASGPDTRPAAVRSAVPKPDVHEAAAKPPEALAKEALAKAALAKAARAQAEELLPPNMKPEATSASTESAGAGTAEEEEARSGPGGEAARLAMQRKLTKPHKVVSEGRTVELPVGYVRVPRLAPAPKQGLLREAKADDRVLHIIFSSGCNWAQHWEAEFVLATAMLAGQRGRITRLVSGCHDTTGEHAQHAHQTFPAGKNDLLVPMAQLNRSVNEHFGLFVTPPFEGAVDFPWINKPSSVSYFMQHAREELDRMGETVVAILDPDFVFLKPLTLVGKPGGEFIASRDTVQPLTQGVPLDVPEKGRPVAQRYGLEGGWAGGRFDLRKIVGEKSAALDYDADTAAKYFTVGPPLMVHVDDLGPLSTLWAKYMRPVLEQEKDILADMWAYCMAAAELGLRHTILDHYMISTWSDGRDGQAFKWVDDWPDEKMSCRDPAASDARMAPQKIRWPTFIHLASNFKAPKQGHPDEWMFHKGHIPATIMDCDSPFLLEAPDNTWVVSDPEQKGNFGRESAWVMCNTVARLNQVLRLYKRKFCPGGYEKRHLVRLVQDKTRDQGCDERRDKWCYPLAQIEGLPDDWREQKMGPVLAPA